MQAQIVEDLLETPKAELQIAIGLGAREICAVYAERLNVPNPTIIAAKVLHGYWRRIMPGPLIVTPQMMVSKNFHAKLSGKLLIVDYYPFSRRQMSEVYRLMQTHERYVMRITSHINQIRVVPHSVP